MHGTLMKTFWTWMLCLVPLGGALVVADAGEVAASQSPVFLQTALGFCHVGGQTSQAGQDPFYWLWKITSDGLRVWDQDFPALEQNTPAAGLAMKDGGLLVAGSRFVEGPVAGHRTWLKRLNRLGALVWACELEEGGRPSVLIPLADGSVLVGGALLMPTAERANQDGWLVCVDDSGQTAWSQSYDRGADECVVEGEKTPTGFLLVMTSGPLNPVEPGPSEVWVLACDPRGHVLREKAMSGARIHKKGGRVLSMIPGGHILVVSTSEMQDSKGAEPGSPAFQAVQFTDELEQRWSVPLRGFSSVLAPVLVRVQNECWVAGASAGGVQVIRLSFSGELLETFHVPLKEEQVGLASVAAAAHMGESLYILGMKADLMSPSVDEQVFLLKLDVRSKKILWLKAYGSSPAP